MTSLISVRKQFYVRRGRDNGQRGQNAPLTAPVNVVPRITRLMALAIRFDQLIRDGVVADQAESARLGHVSRARLTQIVNLLNLAPDIQERLLDLDSSQNGRDTISERHLRPIAAHICWRKQRQLLSVLLSRS